jgi:hypothetical protein
VAGYFSSAPYAEIALTDSRVHKILSAADVIEGNASFLVLGASKGYIATHPEVPEAVGKAIDEAARIIHDDPRRAAEIYLVHEPSRTPRCGGARRRAGRAQGRIRQPRARRRSIRGFHGAARRTQIAARKLEGDRRTGVAEFAEQLEHDRKSGSRFSERIMLQQISRGFALQRVATRSADRALTAVSPEAGFVPTLLRMRG